VQIKVEQEGEGESNRWKYEWSNRREQVCMGFMIRHPDDRTYLPIPVQENQAKVPGLWLRLWLWL
jgi:hypothetical protein